MNRRTPITHARRDWESHDCGRAEPGPGNRNKRLLTDVRHVAHVADACRILADGRIKATVVRDDSPLGRSRTPVSWLSPNQWPPGSIYGHVEFVFDWRKIVAGRKLYWFETVPYRRTPAYRILVADGHAPRRLVVRYKPRKHRGPVVRGKKKKWFWNSDNRVCEFMVQGDLSLEHCKAINFVEHRHDLCKDHGRECPDADLEAHHARFLTIAFVLASSCHSADAILRHEHRGLSPVDEFVNEFVRHLSRETEFRSSSGRPQGAQSLMRAILALWSYRDYRAAFGLARRFSKKAFRKTLITAVGKHFGKPSYRPESSRDVPS